MVPEPAPSQAEAAAQEPAATVQTQEAAASAQAAPGQPAPASEPVAVPSAAGTRRRVAIFSSEAPRDGGDSAVAFYVRESAAALQRAGENVHVFTAGTGTAASQIGGVCYHFIGVATSSDAVAAAGEFSESAARAYRQEVSLGGPFHVAHGYGWPTAAALRVCKEAGVPRTVVTFESTEYERVGQRFEGGVSETVRAAERRAAGSAERVVALCEDVRQQLLWLYELPAEKVFVVHGGVSAQPPADAEETAAARAAHGAGPNDPAFIFIGDLSFEMGPDLLLEAIPAVLRSVPSTRFFFVGEGPLRASLEEQASRTGVANNTCFTGHMTGLRLWDLLCACDAAVFPCRSSKPLATVLFVWSAGKPVIVTHTGPAEFVWHDVTGLKVYPHEQSVLWGVGRLLHEGEFARWMGRNARVAVDEAFTWDAVARKLAEVYWD
jgi:glycosyltransferase involved in cell wall biosynthesis